jgi:predicted Zn-dependent peptidase
MNSKLDNGLTVSHIHLDAPKNNGEVSIGLYLKVGSSYENTSNNGSGNIITKMMMNDPNTILKLSSLGASIRSSYSYDYTSIQLLGPEKNWRDMIILLAEMILSFKITADNAVFVHENALLNQNVMEKSDDFDISSSLKTMHRLLWGNRQYGLPLNGQGNTELTVKHVENFYNKWYVPEQALIIAVGALPIDDYMEVVAEIFGSWEPHASLPPEFSKPVFNGPVISLTHAKNNINNNDNNGNSVQLTFTFSTDFVTGRELMGLRLLEEYLVADDAALLQSALISFKAKSQIFITAHPLGALFTVYVTTPRKVVNDVIMCIVKNISRLPALLETEAGRRSLEYYKKVLIASTTLSVTKPEEYARYYALDHIFTGSTDPLNHMIEGLHTMEMESFRAIVLGVFKTHNLRLLIRDNKPVSSKNDKITLTEETIDAVMHIGKN